MKRFHNNIGPQICKDCRYEVCQMLFVLIMILCPNVLAIEEAASVRNSTKAGTSINEALIFESRNKTAKVKTDPQHHQQSIRLQAFESLGNESTARSISPIELVFKNDSNSNYASLQARLGRHSYNISLPTTTANSTGSQPVALKSGHDKAATSTDLTTATASIALKSIETANKTAEDELNTSDSRLVPQTISSDDELEQIGGRGGNEDANDSRASSASDDNVEVWADGASSTLSERKAVKELTKLLSKGMSGAANQVRLETLENWKRRQKERKIAIESRAKLFEDLLTTAISTHPEKVKKATSANGNKRQRTTQLKEENIQRGLYGSGVPSFRDVSGIDPESADDAENVLTQLQNFASNYDGRQPPVLGVGEEAAVPNEDGPAQSGEDSAGEPSEASSNTDESDGLSDGKGNALIPSKKKPDSSSDRPIVRQFKKIKQQFSNRRKQLDQIKKLFNVELALNPKDGGLMGKSVSGGSKKKEKDSASYESGDDIAIDESSVSKKKSSKSAKMRELMGYLRDNPEILASVMSELTVDSDPRQAGTLVTNVGDDDGGSIGDEQSGELGSASSRKTIKQQQNDIGAAWERRKSISKLLDSAQLDESRLLALLSSRRTRSRSGDGAHLLTPSAPTSIAAINRQASLRPKSAESLLLESLRERQLMNLARLDLVLAEKNQQLQHQLVANRTMSTHANSIYTPSLPSLRDGDTTISNYNKGEPEIPDQTLEQRQPISSAPQEPQSPGAEEEAPQQQYDVQTGPDHQYEPSHMSVSNSARSSSGSNQGGHQQQQHYNQSDHHVNHQPASHRQYLSEKQRPYLPEQPRSYLPEQRHYSSDQQRSYLSDQHQSRSHQSYQQQQQQQQQPQQDQEQQYAAQTTQSSSRDNKQNSLNRFTNWRDVSQSETSSSHRSGKTNSPSNITWVAYDLTTGSSSANVEAHRSGSPPAAPTKQLHQSQRTLDLGSTYDNQSQHNAPQAIGTSQQQQHKQQQVINYPDPTITRPGAQFRSVYQANSYPVNGSMKPAASMPASSSIATDNDHELTTGQTPSQAVEFEMQSDREDRRHKLISGNALARDVTESGANSLVEDNGGGFAVEQPTSEVSRQLSPVDYFSAYKHEMINDSQSSTVRQISKRVNVPELVPQKSSRSEVGAMWA